MHYAKKIIVVFISVFLFQFLSAQSNYITHTLKQGESLSMLAQQYNTTVGDIMRMNGMHGESKLVYGSKIKIPSTKKQSVAVQKSNTTAVNTSTVATPVNEITHVVAKGETLYSISKKYNVSVDQLKAWNHLSDDNAKIGTLLIISDKGADKFATVPVQKQTTSQSQQQPVADNTTVNQTSENTNSNVTVEQDTKQQTFAVTQTDANMQPAAEPASNYSGDGYFAPQFKEKKAKNVQNVYGASKTFKTASGWTDGKYYILVNDIEPGTIVKITADNGTAVYAKVLWNMGDLKENAGINFRISNATAAALHVNESSFNVNVSF